MHRIEVNLSDVDRGVYETRDLRVAQHPSESLRYMMTRVLAYALSYEQGIAFSKGGLSQNDEAPISIVDPTGILIAWIDIGTPSAERLHKASKAARRVSVFTHAGIGLLKREAASRTVHKVEQIEVWRIEPALIDALASKVDRNMKLELLRTGGQLYITVAGRTIEGSIERCSLV